MFFKNDISVKKTHTHADQRSANVSKIILLFFILSERKRDERPVGELKIFFPFTLCRKVYQNIGQCLHI